MPASSEKQRKFFGLVYNCKTKGDCPENIKKVADSMTVDQIRDFLKVESLTGFKEFFLVTEERNMNCKCKCEGCKVDCKKCSCKKCKCEGCKCSGK